MNKKKYRTPLKSLQNNEIVIVARSSENDPWKFNINEFILPATTFLQLSGNSLLSEDIKKITWGFGDESKYVSITNRKQQPHEAVVRHVFRNTECETFSIQASVYTSSQIYLTSTFVISSIKTKSKKNYIDPDEFKKQILDFYKKAPEVKFVNKKNYNKLLNFFEEPYLL